VSVGFSNSCVVMRGPASWQAMGNRVNAACLRYVPHQLLNRANVHASHYQSTSKRYCNTLTSSGDNREIFCVHREALPCDWVTVKRTDGSYENICAVLRPLPRNGGTTRLLICPYCQLPRRGLYGWQVDHWGRYTSSARICSWQCRACASLRYASEGGALVLRSRWSFFRLVEQRYGGCRSPRPEPWYPYVFTSPQEAAEAGVCNIRPI
jgi:hypothetical protein